MNIRTPYAWQASLPIFERQMRTQRLRRRVRFLVRVTRPQEKKKHHVCGAMYGNLLRPTRLPTRKRRGKKKKTGISPLVKIRSLAAYERARRALRGVCEPSANARGAMRRVRFLVRGTEKESRTRTGRRLAVQGLHRRRRGYCSNPSPPSLGLACCVR